MSRGKFLPYIWPYGCDGMCYWHIFCCIGNLVLELLVWLLSNYDGCFELYDLPRR